MKGNPAVPGGSLQSKPTWLSTFGCLATSAFFSCGGCGRPQRTRMNAMEKANSTMARQIAQAASAFEQQRTGNTPKSVTVVLSDTTLVITLHGALSEAEKALAKSPEGAAQVQDFHRQLFVNASESLRQEIKRITGVEVREATAEVEPTTGTVVGVFTTGNTVQVYQLAHSVPADTWSGADPGARHHR
jgi:uncharacterized protein YbcI